MNPSKQVEGEDHVMNGTPVKKIKTDSEKPFITALEFLIQDKSSSQDSTAYNSISKGSRVREFDEIEIGDIDKLLQLENLDKSQVESIMPWGTVARSDGKDITDLFYKHSKSKSCPLFLRTLLVPMPMYYNLECNLLAWISMLNHNLILPFNNHLKAEGNYATIIKPNPWSFQFDIELKFRNDLSKNCVIDVKQFFQRHFLENTLLSSNNQDLKTQIRMALKVHFSQNVALFDQYEKLASKWRGFQPNSSITGSKSTENSHAMHITFANKKPIFHEILFDQTLPKLVRESKVARHYCVDPGEGLDQPKILVKSDFFNLYIMECIYYEILTEKEMSINEFYNIDLKVDMTYSSNPHYCFSDLIFNTEELTMPYFYDWYGVEQPGFVDSKLFCTDLFQKLLNYRIVYKKEKLQLCSMIINNNIYKKDRVSSKKEVLKQAFRHCEDTQPWSKPAILQDDDKGKQQYEKLMSSLYYQIANDGIRTNEAMSHMYENYLKNDDLRGDYLRKNLCSMRTNLLNFQHATSKCDKAKDIPNRRFTIANFVTNHIYQKRDVSDQIDDLELMNDYHNMFEAVRSYLLLTLGTDFIQLMFEHMFKHDQSSKLSKAKGFFISGESNKGKSLLLKIMTDLFDKLYFTNTPFQNFNAPSDQIINKILELFAQVFCFDDFSKMKFDTTHTMSQTIFNNLFDWVAEFLNAPIKNFACQVFGKSPVFIMTHHRLSVIKRAHDPSFLSRFVVVDLEVPILYGNKNQLPPRLVSENEEQYKCRLIKLNLMDEKPLFPLNIQGVSNQNVHKAAKVKNALFKKYHLNVPAQSEPDTDSGVNCRHTTLEGNRLSKNWVHFSEVSIEQASYLFYKVLISIFDDTWEQMTNREREEFFPLQSGRALITDTSPEYSYRKINCAVFKPSLIMRYPDLLETTTLLVKKAIADGHKILL